MDVNFAQYFIEKLKDNNIVQYTDKEIQIIKSLGQGTFGEVFKGVIVETNEDVAVKLLFQFNPDKSVWDTTFEEILTEIKSITTIKHDRIPKFYGIYHKNDQASIGIVISFIDGITLDVYLNYNGNLTVDEKLKIIIDMTEIIRDIHKQNLIHRDIKPANLMVRPDGSLVLLDFGVSKVTMNSQTSTKKLRGTISYSPPEANINDTTVDDIEYKITKNLDVWSIGCCIVKILTGEEPWSKKFKDENLILVSFIRRKHYKTSLDNKLYFPIPESVIDLYPEFYEIIKNCVKYSSEERYDSEKLLSVLKELQEEKKTR